MPNIDTRITLNILENHSEKLTFNAGNPKSRDIYKKRSSIITIDGSNEIRYEEKSAWNKPVKIDSSIDYSGHPLNYIDGNNFFHQEMKRNLKFDKTKVVTDLQLSVNHLSWDPKNFEKNTETYDSYLSGINNLERFLNIPIVCSLPYFEQVPAVVDTA